MEDLEDEPHRVQFNSCLSPRNQGNQSRALLFFRAAEKQGVRVCCESSQRARMGKGLGGIRVQENLDAGTTIYIRLMSRLHPARFFIPILVSQHEAYDPRNPHI